MTRGVSPALDFRAVGQPGGGGGARGGGRPELPCPFPRAGPRRLLCVRFCDLHAGSGAVNLFPRSRLQSAHKLLVPSAFGPEWRDKLAKLGEAVLKLMWEGWETWL